LPNRSTALTTTGFGSAVATSAICSSPSSLTKAVAPSGSAITLKVALDEVAEVMAAARASTICSPAVVLRV
jgi:hypothetical protein